MYNMASNWKNLKIILVFFYKNFVDSGEANKY